MCDRGVRTSIFSLTFSFIFLLAMLVSIRPAWSEELSAFATTTPDLNISKVFKQQLLWQQQHPDDQDLTKCTRGKAQAWFEPKPKFYLQKFKRLSKIGSIEVVKFKTRHHLILLNAGCEFLTVFFRLEFRVKPGEFDLIKTPYVRAVQALQLINKHSNVRVFLVKKSIQHINLLVNTNDIPNYGEYIRIKGDGLKSSQAEFAILKSGVIMSPQKSGRQSKYGFVEFTLSRDSL